MDSKKVESKSKPKQRKTKQKTMKISIAPQIVSDVVKILGVEEDDAMKIIASHVHNILKLASANEEKLYWSNIDVKALYTIFENRLLGNEQSDELLKQLSVAEEWSKQQQFKPVEQHVIDRAFLIMDFCLQNHSLNGFSGHIKSIVDAYTRSQLLMLIRIIRCAIAYVNKDDAAIEKDPEFHKFMYQAAANAIDCAKGKVKKCIPQRLTYIETKLIEFMNERGMKQKEESPSPTIRDDIVTGEYSTAFGYAVDTEPVVVEVKSESVKEEVKETDDKKHKHKKKRTKKHKKHHKKHTEVKS